MLGVFVLPGVGQSRGFEVEVLGPLRLVWRGNLLRKERLPIKVLKPHMLLDFVWPAEAEPICWLSLQTLRAIGEAYLFYLVDEVSCLK